MRVDFYQLSRDPAEVALVLIAGKVAQGGKRMLVVSDDAAQRQRIDRSLWTHRPESFLAHGNDGEGHEAHQPVLLCEGHRLVAGPPENGATYLAITDGVWRDSPVAFERTFFFFDDVTIRHARETWRALGGREGVQKNFWKQDGARWVQAA